MTEDVRDLLEQTARLRHIFEQIADNSATAAIRASVTRQHSKRVRHAARMMRGNRRRENWAATQLSDLDRPPRTVTTSRRDRPG